MAHVASTRPCMKPETCLQQRPSTLSLRWQSHCTSLHPSLSRCYVKRRARKQILSDEPGPREASDRPTTPISQPAPTPHGTQRDSGPVSQQPGHAVPSGSPLSAPDYESDADDDAAVTKNDVFVLLTASLIGVATGCGDNFAACASAISASPNRSCGQVRGCNSGIAIPLPVGAE